MILSRGDERSPTELLIGKKDDEVTYSFKVSQVVVTEIERFQLLCNSR
jgi:hypothetical protein